MPELPEVEAVRRTLCPHVCGRTIEKVELVRPEIVEHPQSGDFMENLTGQTIADLKRRGKFLCFALDSQDTLVLHLRMTGKLSLVVPEVELPKHTHMILSLDDGRDLRFTDTRRLGRVWLMGADETDCTGMSRLGPEPYDVTADELKNAFAARKRAVKSVLMDQHILAGLGNIYADEVLFRCGISPLRPAGDLEPEEVERLVEVLVPTLDHAVDRGVSCSTFLLGKTIKRRQPRGWMVYGRKGKPCRRCGTTLVGVRIGGRSSVYCPQCQK